MKLFPWEPAQDREERNVRAQGPGTALYSHQADTHQNCLVSWAAKLNYYLYKTSAYCTDLNKQLHRLLRLLSALPWPWSISSRRAGKKKVTCSEPGMGLLVSVRTVSVFGARSLEGDAQISLGFLGFFQGELKQKL